MSGLILWQKTHKDWDEQANLVGFIETKRVSFYEDTHQIPIDYPHCVPKPPCLLFEVTDKDIKEFKILKPVDFIELTQEQAEKLKEWFL